MGVNSLPKTVTWLRCGCDLNPGPSAPESSTLTTRPPSHPNKLMLSSNSWTVAYREWMALRKVKSCSWIQTVHIHCRSLENSLNSENELMISLIALEHAPPGADLQHHCIYRLRTTHTNTLLLCHIAADWLPSVLWHCWLGGRKGIRPVNNWVVGCWHGYQPGVRCRLAYGPADATATHYLLLQ